MSDESLADLPNRVAAARAERGASMRDVAAATGLTLSTIHKTEHGGDVRLSTVIALHRWLGDALTCDHEAQIRDLLEEREELLTEIRRLRMGNHPAGRALPHLALAEALTERDAGHEGGGGK